MSNRTLRENAVTVWLVSLIAFFLRVVRNFVKSFLSQCSVCVSVLSGRGSCRSGRKGTAKALTSCVASTV